MMSNASASVPKRRACDECRTRKLACTKEPDGCSRCKREGIPCHYSAQKPMGRPRKRPREDEEEESLTTGALPPPKAPMAELPPDTQDPGMDFLELLLGDDFSFSQSPPEATMVPGPTPTNSSQFEMIGGFGNFSDLNFDPMPAGQSFGTANIDPALFATPAMTETPAADQVPGLSPISMNASSPDSASTSTLSPSTCRCTTKLSSALDSVRSMPSDVEPAIRQARLAAKTAYEAVVCPACSSMMELPSEHSERMMQHFQNLMLLATLIPSLVATYGRILAKVDEETNNAVIDRRQLTFKLGGFGGTWGGLAGKDQEEDPCGVAATFGHREMEPRMWRLMVRALLKLDVYGISGGCGTTAGEGVRSDPFHLGLKDIVLMMETRSKARHALLDTLIEAGVWKEPQCAYLHNTGGIPQCQRIISIARASVDRIVIA